MQTRFVYFVALAIIASTPLFSTPSHADVVGGEDVGPQDPVQRSTAALYQPSANGQGGALCTASLIGPHTAITAAHCFNPSDKNPVMIFGPDVRSPQAQARKVTAVAVNPRWKTHQNTGMDQGDIAMVRIQGTPPAGYGPVEMNKDPDALRKGRSAILAGYGISDASHHTGSGVLRKTRVQVENPRPGKSEMILDQSHGHGACHGDSGGPAFVRKNGKISLAGITNRSYPNSAPDDCAHQVVYTKVQAYQPWIQETEDKLEKSRDYRDKLRKKRGMTSHLSSRSAAHGHSTRWKKKARRARTAISRATQKRHPRKA